MITIDRLSYSSELRYVNAGEKFAFSMITLALCVTGRSVLVSAAVFMVMGILTVRKGKIPFSDYRNLLAVPLVFLIMNALVLGISIRETPLELFAVPIGRWYVTAGKETIRYGIQVFCTAMGAVSCMYFLACNTTMPDLLILLRKMKCPKVLIELMLLIYRFIFVLLDSAHAIFTAQHSRLGYQNYKTSLQSFGALGADLFVRSIKRSGALYDAMEARCYDGKIQVLEEEYPPRRKEIMGIAAFELAVILMLWIEIR